MNDARCPNGGMTLACAAAAIDLSARSGHTLSQLEGERTQRMPRVARQQPEGLHA